MILILTGGDTGGISREEFIGKVAQEVLNKIPQEFELDKIKKKYGLEISPTTVVLLQELERFNNLLNRMRKSLNTLQKVGVNINTGADTAPQKGRFQPLEPPLGPPL